MKSKKRGVSYGILTATALGLLGALGVFSAAASAQTYLYNFATFPTGKTPTAVAVGDFKGDGKPDVAVANQDDSTVSILLGKPDGSFAPQVTYATGLTPRAVTVADFNGDGKLDLAVVDFNCTSFCGGPGLVSILLGNGDGTFQEHVDFQVGGQPIGIVAADFNGDKRIDLAVANNSDGTVSILLGNGDGTFQSQKTISVPGYPQTIAGGDFNGDGREDLIVLDANVSVLLSNGDGTFNRIDTSLPPFASVGIAVGDFNGDGKLDAVVGDTSPLGFYQPQVLLGNGDGTFQPPSPTAIFANFASADVIVAADFNHDGILDLAFAGHGVAAAAAVALGNGDGSFQYPLKTVSIISSIPISPIAVGDFNGDGRLDLVEANPGNNSASVLLGNGDGRFGTVGTFEAAPAGFSGPDVVADFN